MDTESFLAGCAIDLQEFTEADRAAWKQFVFSPTGRKVMGFLQLERMQLGAAALAIRTYEGDRVAARQLADLQGQGKAFIKIQDLLLNLTEPSDARTTNAE